MGKELRLILRFDLCIFDDTHLIVGYQTVTEWLVFTSNPSYEMGSGVLGVFGRYQGFLFDLIFCFFCAVF